MVSLVPPNIDKELIILSDLPKDIITAKAMNIVVNNIDLTNMNTIAIYNIEPYPSTLSLTLVDYPNGKFHKVSYPNSIALLSDTNSILISTNSNTDDTITLTISDYESI